jgi:hypothetical protein
MILKANRLIAKGIFMYFGFIDFSNNSIVEIKKKQLN